jgi:tetratricopeptide (TPR) repeat protein
VAAATLLGLGACTGTQPTVTGGRPVSPADRTIAAARVEDARVEDARVGEQVARLKRAETLTAAGSYDEALEVLGPVEPGRNEALYPEYVWLRARIAAARNDSGLAGYYAGEFVSARDEGSAAQAAYQLLGDLSFASGDHGAAFGHYLEAVNRSGEAGEFPGRLWLRLAEMALYERADPEGARHYLSSGRLTDLTAEDQSLLRRLVRRLQWRTLDPPALGLNDGNVSALAADGDDLWIGTWNGGVARYSAARGQATVFREGSQTLTANTVRCLAVASGRVWIGTYQGLFVYSKAASAWQEVERFGGASPMRVETVVAAGERVFVGTLGDGLWVLDRGTWQRLSRGGLPGEFVTCLLAAEGELLVGTMTLGVVILNLATGAMHSLDAVQAGLEARNVTMLIHDPPDTVWIGTYGSGLYQWDRGRRRIQRFSRADGQLSDDWVLCGVRGARGLYFGTFGGGVSLFADGRWRSVGLREGLAALDISSVAYLPPYVCFGTLGSGVCVLDESLGESLAEFVPALAVGQAGRD